MIDAGAVQALATKYQTTGLNVAREYFQHAFLSAWYRRKAADRALFKGGTALRIIYGSPRFSEDLDFSGFRIRPAAIEGLLTDVLSDLEQLGIGVEIEEAKTTSGGYLGIIRSRLFGYPVDIHLEISLRPHGLAKPATALIAGDFLPAYTLLHLPQERLVEEKLRALLDRAKPRDFYDLYFILRKGLLAPGQRAILAKVLERLRRLRPEAFQELKVFLPKDHQGVLKDFRAALERELRQFVG